MAKKKTGITDIIFAERLGMSRQATQKIYANSDINTSRLYDICEALDVDIGEFFGYTKEDYKVKMVGADQKDFERCKKTLQECQNEKSTLKDKIIELNERIVKLLEK